MDEKEFCVKLIRAVKARPCLYNFSCNEYSKDALDKIWKEVATELDADVMKCKEKWKNIKIVLKRHLRKGVIKRRRKYYLFDHLRFVIPYMKVKDPLTYNTILTPSGKEELIETNVDTDPLSEEHANNYIQTEISDDIQYTNIETCNNSLIDHTYNDDSLVQEEYGFHIPDHTEMNSKRRKSSEEMLDAKRICSVEFTNERKKQDEEAKKSFLMSLLPDLNQMNGQQTRYFKKCVLEIVEEILDGDLSTSFRTINPSTLRPQKFC